MGRLRGVDVDMEVEVDVYEERKVLVCSLYLV